MQSENFKNDDGLYELINASDNFEEINTSRTEDFIFNSNPIDWHGKIHVHNQYLTKYHLNENNSSVVLPENDQSSFNVQSALEKNAILDLPSICKNYFQSSMNSTPQSKFLNEKVCQNVENFLPQKFTKDLKQSYNMNYILCPECKMRNLPNLSWCLSCGLFLIKQKNTKSFAVTNVVYESDNNIILNNWPQKIISKENRFYNPTNEIVNNSAVFDKLFKRKNEVDDGLFKQVNEINDDSLNSLKNSELNVVKSTEENSNVMHFNSDIKLNISELELSLCENKHQLSKFDLDIDISEPVINKSIDINASPKIPMIPPLDLSNLDFHSGVNKVSENVVIKYKEVSKENEKKPVRKWASSSMAWEDKPVNLLKKKPGRYYRNKLNSCTNKIGSHVYPSKIETGVIWLSDNQRNKDQVVINNSSQLENNWIDINSDDYNLSSETRKNELMNKHNILNLSRWNTISYEETETFQSVQRCDKNNCNISDIYSNSVNNWQCLPAEIWIKIMIYLSRSELSKLQQTCRRIYSIGLDSQFWRCVTLFRCNNLTDYHIINIAQKMPKELHFKNCFGTSITFNGLKEMFSICGRGVEKLSFISCSKGALEGDQFLVLSAAFCPNVTHINASYLMNLQDSTLISMTEGFNKIVSLNLMGANSISNESIKSLIKNHRNSLTSLDLYGCFRLNSSTLRILEECLNLKSLALGSINKLKRASMVDLLRKLSQLTNLDLRGTMNLIDDPLLAQICILCPNLQQIIITNSCLVGNKGLNSLANSNVSKTLKVLDICGCSRITDKGVEAILKNCQNLEDLDISCTGITGRITKLFNMYPPPNLKCLRVNNNKLISETELASIIKSSKKLNTVYMCGITSIDIDKWPLLEAEYQKILFKHE